MAAFPVGSFVLVSGGKYENQVGKVHSCTAQRAKLELRDGTVTGDLRHADLIDVVCERGNRVLVHGGKYDGEKGSVKSVAAQSCRLVMDNTGTETGNISLFQIELLPDEPEGTFYKGGQFMPGGGRAPAGGAYHVPDDENAGTKADEASFWGSVIAWASSS